MYNMGRDATGIMIEKIAKAHLQPIETKIASAAAGPANVVAIYGLMENANSQPRSIKLEVSARKTWRT